MTTFDSRERDAERKFEHDAELRFKAMARRNKLLGLWAADHLGIAGDAANAYAKEVVLADFDRPGDEDVLEKVLKDFQARNLDIDGVAIRREMDRLWPEAKKQIMAE